jgi:hypothetical protein
LRQFEVTDVITLWRCVAAAERDDIETTGRFRMPAGGGTGHKYFALNQADALRFGAALKVFGESDLWLASAEAPAGLLAIAKNRFFEVTTEGPVEAVLLGVQDLPRLGPAGIINALGDID